MNNREIHNQWSDLHTKLCKSISAIQAAEEVTHTLKGAEVYMAGLHVLRLQAEHLLSVFHRDAERGK